MGNRIPFALKIFLTALAIIDDLGAVLVIALFYTHELHVDMLLYAAILLGGLFILNKLKVTWLIVFILAGLLLWWLILKSGIHATIAGVVLAFFIPISKVEALEHAIHKPVNYLIMPLFALANTTILVPIAGMSMLIAPFSWGLSLGWP
jgi:NhaA family Na+:H+ antiporter